MEGPLTAALAAARPCSVVLRLNILNNASQMAGPREPQAARQPPQLQGAVVRLPPRQGDTPFIPRNGYYLLAAPDCYKSVWYD